MLNLDGQPISQAFNFKRNRDKSAYALRGILHGIVADEKLNDTELLFLDCWIGSQEHLDADGDVVDLLNLTCNILKDGHISSDELEELKALIADVIEYGNQSSEGTEDRINELLGLLLGISADGKITEGEFKYLDKWLTDNSDISGKWPANVLIERIRDIKDDGVIDEEEKQDLLETLKQITGQRFDETGSADGAVAEVFSDEVTGFRHNDKKICFTGKFVCGTRKVCENSAKKKGATIAKRVTADLDVLILGTLASHDWRFTSHGRKIEQVLEHRKKGRDILVLSERTWLKFL